MDDKKIGIASDHAGYQLKEFIIGYLDSKGYDVHDFGCHSEESCDANVCSMPARFIDRDTAIKIVDTFLSTEFEGGRHQRRIDKIPVSGCGCGK